MAEIIRYRQHERDEWQTYTHPRSSRPVVFLDYRAALNYALDSHDERLAHQFKIERPETNHGHAH